MLKSLKTKLLLPLLLIGSLFIAGCNGGVINSLGAGPLPQLPEPAPLTFDAEQAERLNKWVAEDPALFKKLQAQTHAYRETIRSYNKYAKATNRKKLEALGFDEKSIKATLNDDGNLNPGN